MLLFTLWEHREFATLWHNRIAACYTNARTHTHTHTFTWCEGGRWAPTCDEWSKMSNGTLDLSDTYMHVITSIYIHNTHLSPILSSSSCSRVSGKKMWCIIVSHTHTHINFSSIRRNRNRFPTVCLLQHNPSGREPTTIGTISRHRGGDTTNTQHPHKHANDAGGNVVVDHIYGPRKRVRERESASIKYITSITHKKQVKNREKDTEPWRTHSTHLYTEDYGRNVYTHTICYCSTVIRDSATNFRGLSARSTHSHFGRHWCACAPALMTANSSRWCTVSKRVSVRMRTRLCEYGVVSPPARRCCARWSAVHVRELLKKQTVNGCCAAVGWFHAKTHAR